MNWPGYPGTSQANTGRVPLTSAFVIGTRFFFARTIDSIILNNYDDDSPLSVAV